MKFAPEPDEGRVAYCNVPVFLLGLRHAPAIALSGVQIGSVLELWRVSLVQSIVPPVSDPAEPRSSPWPRPYAQRMEHRTASTGRADALAEMLCFGR